MSKCGICMMQGGSVWVCSGQSKKGLPGAAAASRYALPERGCLPGVTVHLMCASLDAGCSTIPDEDAQKPEGWLDNEPAEIDDTSERSSLLLLGAALIGAA